MLSRVHPSHWVSTCVHFLESLQSLMLKWVYPDLDNIAFCVNFRTQMTMAQIAVSDSVQVLDKFARNLKLEKALVDSPWFQALESRNCQTLKCLLRKDKDLVRKTSFEGRTVLHVAVIQGCLDLVESILQLFGDGLGTEEFKIRYEVLLTAKDGRCGGVTALVLAQEFLGMEKIIQCLQFGPSHNQQAMAQDDQSLKTVQDIISKAFLKVFKSEYVGSMLEHEFHKACSKISVENPIPEDLEFYGEVVKQCLDAGDSLLQFLLNLRDSEGKPPFHNFLASRPESYNAVAPNAMCNLTVGIPKEGADLIHEALQKATDADGRTFCHRNVHCIIRQLFLTKRKFDSLKASFGEDVDYNFHNIECNLELMFHHAFSKLGMEESEVESESMDFVLEVMELCLAQGDVGVTTLTFLFKLPNAQGRPPFHALLASSEIGYAKPVYLKVNKLIDTLFHDEAPIGLGSCVSALDAMGRTIFHRNVSMKPDKSSIHHVFDHEKLKAPEFMNLLNTKMKSSIEKGGATALHLAILHNQPLNVVRLLECNNIDLNAMVHRRIQYGQGRAGQGDWWSPLQLAALLGNPPIVKALLAKIEEIYDAGKWKNKLAKPDRYNERMPAFHLAAASGNSEVLRLFLYDMHFNQMTAIPLKLGGSGVNGYRTALHLAADETLPIYEGRDYDIDACSIFKMVGPPVSLADIDNHHMLQSRLEEDDVDTPKTIRRKVYNGKKRCMTMLVEAGSDMWRRDENGDFLEPRWAATDEDKSWWHDKIRSEVIEAKKNLNAAGNAISVVAALVATASYAGPPQPPLGVISDHLDGATAFQAQYDSAVRIFVVSNSFSFSIAIVALMLSLLPCLPVSQESLYDEWRHSRGTISTALFALLLSVLSFLVSFGAAICAGMPDYKSVRHSYAFYPTITGGFICLIVIVLCFARVLRLMKPENKAIKSIHKASVRLFEFL